MTLKKIEEKSKNRDRKISKNRRNSNWNPTFSNFRDFSRFSRFFENFRFFSKIFFQSHLKKFLLDEFSKFWYLEKVEIISFHEHLKSFNSSDSSPSYRTKRACTPQISKRFFLALKCPNPGISSPAWYSNSHLSYLTTFWETVHQGIFFAQIQNEVKSIALKFTEHPGSTVTTKNKCV